jgi:hypothetical protein
MKSGNLNFLEPSGLSRPITGLLYLIKHKGRLFSELAGTYFLSTITASVRMISQLQYEFMFYD